MSNLDDHYHRCLYAVETYQLELRQHGLLLRPWRLREWWRRHQEIRRRIRVVADALERAGR